MTTEQERKMLECAAKACGHNLVFDFDEFMPGTSIIEEGFPIQWNPLANAADTAEMCAELEIDTAWFKDKVLCAPFGGYKSWAEFKDHDNSRLNAWMYAATMYAAKTQGYEE